MDWDYTIRGYRQKQLLLVTVHRGEASRDVELSVWRVRGLRGEATHVEVLDHARAVTTTIPLMPPKRP
jgi:hypothetical protein